MRILVVDDDVAARKMLRFVLEEVGGHIVDEAEGVGQAEQALRGGYDLVTLDVVMPDGDGFQLCRRIRRVSNVPVVMLSAKSALPDRVQGLRIGADDYIGKPFDPSELLARIDALARRARRVTIREDGSRVRIGELVLDLAQQSVTIRGRVSVRLTRTEFRLLLDLVHAGGEPRSRGELEMAVWGTRMGASPNTIDSYISDLRHKVEPDHARPRYILTVRGRGYRLAC
ncbi:MAG TPA: response regulator transcription factor [Chloroflexota bacterium]|nr:response regulator transcription factor [Chloroflexota bacterium]